MMIEQPWIGPPSLGIAHVSGDSLSRGDGTQKPQRTIVVPLGRGLLQQLSWKPFEIVLLNTKRIVAVDNASKHLLEEVQQTSTRDMR